MAEIGSVIAGKYEILTEIGHGGMSVVYLAMDTHLNKQWAVKEIRKKGNGRNDEVIVNSLLAEANMMKRLDHPSLPRIVDIIDNGVTIFVVMDYIEGESLDKILAEYGAQPEELVVGWAKQLCDALSYLHSQKPPIIYRDMKPANVMLKPEGNIKIIDFGIAREYKEQNLADTTVLGTKGYAPPEQYSGQTDARSDIFALGMTMHHLLTGIDPRTGEAYAPVRMWNPEVSEGVEMIIDKCVQPAPENRYQNCQDLLYDLEHPELITRDYKKKQKIKLNSFVASIVLAIVCVISGVVCNRVSVNMNNGDYEVLVSTSTASSLDEKISNYKKAIDIYPMRTDAYFKMIEAYEDEGKFGKNENDTFLAVYNAHKDEFDNTTKEVAELNYKIGMMYFNYYTEEDGSYSFSTRVQKAYEFFCENNTNATGFEQQKTSDCYYQICSFYKKYILSNTNVEEASKDNYDELLKTIESSLNDVKYAGAYVYDAENQLVEVIEPDGAKTKKTYDRDGNLVAVTNAMDHVTSYTYDDLGRRISRTNAEGATTSLFYNNMGQVERVCHPNGTQTFYTYDLGGRVKSVKNPDGSGEIYEYDLKGNLISRANGMEDKISFKYDALDRLVEIVNQVEGVRKFTYDAVGNLTSIIDEKGNKTTYDYSPNGNLMKVTDALGNETFYEYDAMNRLVKTLCTGANGEESQNTDFVWDVMGQIKSVTDPLGYVESYEYDKNGNMTSKTDRDGYTINFTYGSHGKIEEIVYADGKTVEMSYDALRRLNEVKDWNGITKITLDAIGRALSVTEPNGDTVGYEWGLMGEKKAVIYPNGKRAEYSYNTEMQLVSLHTERETIQYAYDEIGRLTKKILPNGIETNYHYNAMGRVDEISHIGNEFAESYKYSFDIYGNKVSAIKNRVGAEVDNGHFAYVYDELNRLTEVHQNDTLLRKYSYDAFGNRVSKANYASRMESVTSYTYNVNNQLLSEVDGTMTKDYTYDNRGNLLKVSTGADILKEFTFDATNQMTASFDLVDGQRKKATYTYNGLGHRVGQKISSLIPEYPEKKIRYTIDMTRQYYNLLQKSEGGASQTYYWDGNVVGMESNGVEKFYLQDDFGSPMHLVDIYGTSQECFAFDEFGENLSTSYNNTSQTFGFTGYQTDEVGDLYYAQARRYDASVGRFVSEDKVRGFVILPYTLNHYGYCWNNPVDFVDRDGNLPTVVIGAVIGLAAGALGEVVSQTIDGVQSGKSVLDSLLDVNPGKVVLEAGKGAVTGAVAGTGAGLLVVAGTSGVVEFGGDLLDQKVLQKKEDLDYTHAISNGLWSATTTLVVGGITNEISNVIHPEAKTGTMDYLFGRDKAKAVVKAQYNNARSSSSRAKYWNRLEKIKLQKTLGTIKYGIIETGKTIIDEIKNEIYRDEVNEDIVEEIDKKISCSVY